jgi:medium-chain acyl-[acyl-carrier-protein] hydrolase
MATANNESGQVEDLKMYRPPQNEEPSVQFEEIINRLRNSFNLPGVPAAIMGDPELVELMGNCLKADLAIVEDYEPDGEAPLECPIVAIGGDDDAWVARNELDAWAQHTTGDFSSVQFRGGHFYFRTPDVQQALLALIRETCLKASNRSST